MSTMIFFLITAVFSLETFATDYDRIYELLRKKHYAAVLRELDPADAGKDQNYHIYRGLALELSGNLGAAKMEYQVGRKLGETPWLSHALQRVDSKNEENRHAQQSLYERAAFLYREEKFAEVIALAETDHASHLPLETLRIDAYLALGELAKARELVSDLRKRHPFAPELVHLEFEVAARSGEKNSAQKKLRELQIKDDDSANENYELAVLFVNEKEPGTARELLHRALTRDPKHIGSYELLGYIDTMEESYPEAILNYRRAIALGSNDPQDYLNLAQIYGTIDDVDDELKVLLRGEALSPRNADVLNRLGYHYEIHRNLPKAQDYYERALSADPRNSFATLALRRLRDQLSPEIYAETSYAKTNFFLTGTLTPTRDTWVEKTNRVLVRIPTISSLKLSASYSDKTFERRSIENDDARIRTLAVTADFDVSETSVTAGLSPVSLSYPRDPNVSVLNPTLLISRTVKAHTLSAFYTRSVQTSERNGKLAPEHFDVTLAQDQVTLSPRWSLLVRGLRGQSAYNRYNIATLSPIYRIPGTQNVTLRAQADIIKTTGFAKDTYPQVSTGALWQKRWKHSWESSLDGETGYRDTANKYYIRSDLRLIYSGFRLFDPMANATVTENIDDGLPANYSLSLGAIARF